MLKERNDRKGGKKDKVRIMLRIMYVCMHTFECLNVWQVVLRELCSVLSRGTRTYNHLDDLTLLEEESSPASQSSASILLCIVEKSGQDYHQQYSSVSTCLILLHKSPYHRESSFSGWGRRYGRCLYVRCMHSGHSDWQPDPGPVRGR